MDFGLAQGTADTQIELLKVVRQRSSQKGGGSAGKQDTTQRSRAPPRLPPKTTTASSSLPVPQQQATTKPPSSSSSNTTSSSTSRKTLFKKARSVTATVTTSTSRTKHTKVSALSHFFYLFWCFWAFCLSSKRSIVHKCRGAFGITSWVWLKIFCKVMLRYLCLSSAFFTGVLVLAKFSYWYLFCSGFDRTAQSATACVWREEPEQLHSSSIHHQTSCP